MPATRSQASAKKKRKGSAKPKGMAQGNTRAWRHDGIVASRFRAATSDAESYAQRLMFDYKVSVEVHGRFAEQSDLDSISLHDMVAGDLAAADKNMHVGALSDFMKTLLVTTPSAEAMQEMLESSGEDPLGALSAAATGARKRAYGAHAVLARISAQARRRRDAKKP
jgi:hypothetical protein